MSNVKVKGLVPTKSKNLITRNIHVKYENSGTHCLKVISKVKVFKK